MIGDIRDALLWIQENPKKNRIKLCVWFENDNDFAYDFALEHVQYRDFIKHFITEPEIAYYWAWNIGNVDFMRDKVVEPEWAYWWALEIGDKEHMKQYITHSHDAYMWARDVGNIELMKSKITDPDDAYCWARDIGHEHEMKRIVEQSGEQYWIKQWNTEFRNNPI